MGAGAHWDLWDADCSSRYTNWNEGEPNDDPKTGGDENCACISAEGEDNTWFDVPCYMPAACVCEQVGSAALVVPTAHTPWPPGAESPGTWLCHSGRAAEPLSGSSGWETAVRLWVWQKPPICVIHRPGVRVRRQPTAVPALGRRSGRWHRVRGRYCDAAALVARRRRRSWFKAVPYLDQVSAPSGRPAFS